MLLISFQDSGFGKQNLWEKLNILDFYFCRDVYNDKFAENVERIFRFWHHFSLLTMTTVRNITFIL